MAVEIIPVKITENVSMETAITLAHVNLDLPEISVRQVNL